jgi:carboxypeptidase family protein/TonB-dependent receptor-like protein
MRFGLLRCVTGLLLMMVVICARSHAQTTSATVTGQITDQSGRLVPGAAVMFTNINTGVPYTTETNGEGIYTVPTLQPGVYRANITKDGFKSIVKPDIELHVQDQVSINFALQLGSVSETITVEGGAPLLNTTDGSVGMVVDHNFVENMPLNGRSFQDLILLTPGTVTQTPQNLSASTGLGISGEFSVNGQRPESNYYTVDGVSADVGASSGTGMIIGAGASGSVPLASALGTTQALVSVDDLQEFRVQSSTYSAEYGRNPGGQFVFETKSGTNQFHGSAFEYLRNGALDANDWFTDYFHAGSLPLRQNDFGGILGGPVEAPSFYHGKDKTFFFISYEGLRLVQPQAATVNFVPDSALRATAPAPLNQVLNAFPVANGPDDVANGIAQFIAGWSNPSSLDTGSFRVDHVVNDKLRLFFRFSETNSDSVSRGTGSGNTPSQIQSTEYVARTYTGGLSGALTSRIGNEFRLNYSSNEVTTSQAIDSFGGNTAVDLAQLSDLGPGAAVSAGILYGGYFLSIEQFRQSAIQRQWNLVDTLSVSWRRHQLKFGGDYRTLAPVATPLNPGVFYYYFDQAGLLANNGFAETLSVVQAFPLYRNFSAFAQDQWHVSSRLNLSLGLRWDVNPAPGVTQGLEPYTVQGSSPASWTLAPQGTPLWNTTLHNFAPRLGLAYELNNSAGHETVIRGGVGVFYDTGQQLGSQGFQGPGFEAFSFLPASFPLPAAEASTPIVNPPVPPYQTTVFAFPSDLQLPYTLEWNVTVEQALGSTQALSVAYVGSHAARLLELSQISASAVGNPNSPDGFIVTKNGLTSDYSSLQVQFHRSLSRGLTALASYTWSHCIDFGSQNYFFAYQRGNCDFDIRHSLSTAFSYNVPNYGRNRFWRAVADHWELNDRLSARTAFPVTLSGATIIDPATGESINGGLNLAPNQPVYLYGSNCNSVLEGLGDLTQGQSCPGGRAVNPNAFTIPASGIGDAPRNFVRGFGAWQMDLAVQREFPLYERLRLQFRAEAFNVFNHPNFGSINGNFGQPTFGQATATLANSLGILSPIYQMGGPRSLQFGLRLTF